MVKEDPSRQQDTPGATTLQLVAILAGALIIISVAAVMFAGGPQPSVPALSTPPESQVPTPSGTEGSPAQEPATPDTPAEAPPLPTAEETQTPVDFVLESGDPVSCGLTCRQLTATITNDGGRTAHNVCISLRMQNSRGDVIGLNGGETLTQCVGDLDPGQKKSAPVTINADCGAFASKCIQETLTLKTEVVSDEARVRFPDQLIAV